MTRLATEELCCLVSKAHWNANDRARAQVLFESPDFSIIKFWELATFNAVEILAAQKLSSLEIRIPDEVQEGLQATHRKNTGRRENVLMLIEALHRQGIATYLLKGFLLGEMVYNDAAYKRMNDIDILIKPAQVLRAVEIANLNGFSFATGPLLGSSPVDFRLHHSPPLLSQDKSTIIGLHWGIASPYATRRPRTDIFEGAREIRVNNVSAMRMSHEHNVLHMCMHLPFFKIGLRELADVANLLNYAKDDFDFEKLLKLSHAWHAHDALYRILTLTDCAIPCLSSDNKTSLFEISAPFKNSRYVTDTNRRAASLSLLLRSRSTYVGKVEKNYVLFKLAARFRDRAFHLKEQWRLVLRVPKCEQERLVPNNVWFRGARSSGALCFSMVQDLGAKLFMAVTVYNVLSLFKPSQRDPRDFIVAKQLLEKME
jgi:hypothetical protein